MEGGKIVTEIKKTHLSFECPFCGHKATFNTLKECIIEKEHRSYLTMFCPNCWGMAFVVYNTWNNKIENIYPKSVPKCDSRVPQKIAADFLEAKRCFGAGVYKGTVVMCRRSIQNTAVEKGAKKDDLFEQLNELVRKGIIPVSLEKLSHNVRSMGNYGAHPAEDGLDKVEEKDAKEILEFLEHFLNYVFVMPQRVEEMESRVKSKKKGRK